MIKKLLKQNWFKLFIVIAVLVYLALFAFGKYVEVKAHNRAVLEMAATFCQEITDEEKMKDCAAPIITNEYIDLPFSKIITEESEE